MKTQTTTTRQIAAALVVGALAAACRSPFATMGETRTETRTVESGAVAAASVLIEMNAGELTLAGGADDLLEADFRYNVDDWQPQVDYAVDGDRGALEITQPDTGLPVGDELINDWELRLGSELPLDLVVHLGAGDGELELGALDLMGVQVETGAAAVTIDLRGDWDHDVNATIRGGVGDLSILLPSTMGVRVTADTALVNLSAAGLTHDDNTYVNATYGTAPYTLHIEVEAGIGAVELQVR
jgi:hypothetical protein